MSTRIWVKQPKHIYNHSSVSFSNYNFPVTQPFCLAWRPRARGSESGGSSQNTNNCSTIGRKTAGWPPPSWFSLLTRELGKIGSHFVTYTVSKTATGGYCLAKAFIITEKARARKRRWEGVSVMRDKELKKLHLECERLRQLRSKPLTLKKELHCLHSFFSADPHRPPWHLHTVVSRQKKWVLVTIKRDRWQTTPQGRVMCEHYYLSVHS